ncbi:MAG: heparan-alpha-glucosaminide N-acetyltransferase domain-containing protein [Niabella sp.]
MNRLLSLDLARGFTVLFIPAIHTGMLYSRLSVHTTPLGYFLVSIAEGPGGQLLMLLMGVTFTLKAQHSARSIMIRSATLLLAGYLLNILKFVVPYSLGLLPREVLAELEIKGTEAAVWQLAGMGDILHFAAIAQIILYGVYKFKNYQWWALGMAIAVAILSPLLWDRQPTSPVLHYLAGLATGHPPKVFFPLLPWLIFPLAGLCIGCYLKKQESQTMKRCAVIGLILLLEGWIEQISFKTINPHGFYRTPFPETCWHLGIVLLALSMWYWISKRAKDNLFFHLLTYSSKNITLLYFIQWVMICWLLPVFGFRRLDTFHSAMVMAVMTADTYILAFFINRIKQRYGYNKSL